MGHKQGERSRRVLLRGAVAAVCQARWFMGTISEDYQGSTPQAWQASNKRLGEVRLVEKQLPQCRK